MSSNRALYLNKVNDEDYRYFSWGCYVEEWVEYSKVEEIPSEIVGRFSYRVHPKNQRIVPHRLRLLAIAMYESRASNQEGTS